jgi:mRNA interferase RelE/StbE
MKVEFRKSFAKDLIKIKDQKLLNKVKQAIENIEITDQLSLIPNLKKLQSEGQYYRIRVSNYRIGLLIKDDTLVFVRFLHRREMYQYFP